MFTMEQVFSYENDYIDEIHLTIKKQTHETNN